MTAQTGRGFVIDDDFLRGVADAHRAATDAGVSTVGTIAAQWDVHRRTAQRWIQLARVRGLLPASGYRRESEAADEALRLLRAQYPNDGHLVSADSAAEVVAVAQVWSTLALVEEVRRVADALEDMEVVCE